MSHQCQKCGQCCKIMLLEIWGLDIDREPRLAEHAVLFSGQEDEPDAYKAYHLPSPCPMLTSDNKCLIYATRPTMCVAFGKGESSGGDPDAERCLEIRENLKG